MKIWIERNGSGWGGYYGIYIIDTGKKKIAKRKEWNRFTEEQTVELLKQDIENLDGFDLCDFTYDLSVMEMDK